MAAIFRLDKAERKRLQDAIRDFERQTSAELVVLVSKKAKGEPVAVATKEFHRLRLTKTQLRNAILIAVLANLRQVVVLGDEGIHKSLPEGTWQNVVELIVKEFREGRYYQGLANAIEEVGRLFGQYFPYQTDDVNEIPDEIVES